MSDLDRYKFTGNAAWAWVGSTNATATEPVIDDETRTRFLELLVHRAIIEMVRCGMLVVPEFVVAYENLHHERLCRLACECIVTACARSMDGVGTQDAVKALLEKVT